VKARCSGEGNRAMPTPDTQSRRGAHLLAAVLIAAAALPLLLHLRHWFREDDYLWLYGWHDATLWNLPAFFRRGPLFFWRPLQAWLSALIWRACGMNPLGPNLALLLLWTGVLVQLYRLVRRLAPAEAAAPFFVLGAALLFAPHLHVPYFWFSLLGEAVATFLLLAALLWWLPDSPRHHRHPLPAALLFSTALLAKESVAPLLLLFPAACLLRPGRRIRPRTLLPWILPLAVAVWAAAMDLLPPESQSYQPAYVRLPPHRWPGHLISMLTPLFLPPGAAADAWPTFLNRAADRAAATLPWLGAALLILLFLIRRDRLALFAAAWILAALLPFAPGQTLYPRYLHLSSWGAALLVGLCAARLYRLLPAAPRAGLLGVIGALCLYALACSYLMLVLQTHQQEYGRRLYLRLTALDPHQLPAAVIVRDLDPETCNRGLGLTELARLALGREDVWVFLQDDLQYPAVQDFLSRSRLHRIFITAGPSTPAGAARTQAEDTPPAGDADSAAPSPVN